MPETTPQQPPERTEAAVLRELINQLVKTLGRVKGELFGPAGRHKATRTVCRIMIENAERDAAAILDHYPDPDPMWQTRLLAAAEMYRALEAFERIDKTPAGPQAWRDLFNVWINFPNEPRESPGSLMRSGLALARRQAGAKPPLPTTNGKDL